MLLAHHLRQRHREPRRDLRRCLVLHPAEQRGGDLLRLLGVAQRCIADLRRVAPPRVHVEELLQVANRVALRRLAHVRGEPAVLLAVAEAVLVLGHRVEELEPLVVDRLDERLGERVVDQDGEPGVAERARERDRCVRRGVIDHLDLHGPHATQAPAHRSSAPPCAPTRAQKLRASLPRTAGAVCDHTQAPRFHVVTQRERRQRTGVAAAHAARARLPSGVASRPCLAANLASLQPCLAATQCRRNRAAPVARNLSRRHPGSPPATPACGDRTVELRDTRAWRPVRATTRTGRAVLVVTGIREAAVERAW